MKLRLRKLALIIPGHNEELVIAETIRSAIKAGQNKRDIFVVSDASTDATVAIAGDLLGQDHVLQVERSGKAGAVRQAIDRFDVIARYRWMHIADADSVFASNYFKVLKSKLDPKRYVAASGYVQSLPGNFISMFRVYEYTFGNSIVRRIQSWLGVITVIPGPTSVLRTDMIEKLNFMTGSVTEDFDITLQIHRHKLGKIQFIPGAKSFTQDPRTFRDFYNQVRRWYLGFFQGVRAYGIGRQLSRIDTYLVLMMAQTVLYTFGIFVILPFLVGYTRQPAIISVLFLSEVAVSFATTLACAAKANRLDILSAYPMFLVLRWVNIFIFFKCFFEVILMRGYRESSVGWSTAGRRYKITSQT